MGWVGGYAWVNYVWKMVPPAKESSSTYISKFRYSVELSCFSFALTVIPLFFRVLRFCTIARPFWLLAISAIAWKTACVPSSGKDRDCVLPVECEISAVRLILTSTAHVNFINIIWLYLNYIYLQKKDNQSFMAGSVAPDVDACRILEPNIALAIILW